MRRSSWFSMFLYYICTLNFPHFVHQGTESTFSIIAEIEGSLSKLERDAALGQGMDFESRGQVPDAIRAFVKAIDGGLRLPAAYYTLGMLYLQNNQRNEAKKLLAIAAQDPVFARGAKAALQGD